MSLNKQDLVDSTISFEEIIKLRKFGNELMNCKTLDEVLKILFKKIHLTIKPQISSVFLFSKEGDIKKVGTLGTDRENKIIDKFWFPEERYKPGESFSGAAMKPANPAIDVYGTSVFSTDIINEFKSLKFRKIYLDKLGDLREGIAVPLNGVHRTFGTIEVINKLNTEGGFDTNTCLDKKDFCWLTVVGAHVSAAISRLRKAEEDRIIALITRELVDQSIHESRTSDALGDEVAKSLVLSELMPYKACIIRKLGRDGKTLQVDANESTSDIKEKPNCQRYINEEGGLIKEIFSSRKPVKIEKIETQIDRFKSKEWILEHDLKSFFGFPLLIQGKAVGTMALFTGYEYKLDRNEENFINNINFLLAAYRVGVRTLVDSKKHGLKVLDGNDHFYNEIEKRDTTKLSKSKSELFSLKKKIEREFLYKGLQLILYIITVSIASYALIFLSLSVSFANLIILVLLFLSFLIFNSLVKTGLLIYNYSQLKRLMKKGALLEKEV